MPGLLIGTVNPAGHATLGQRFPMDRPRLVSRPITACDRVGVFKARRSEVDGQCCTMHKGLAVAYWRFECRRSSLAPEVYKDHRFPGAKAV